MDAVTTVPATSMRTSAVVCPFFTSTIVPLSRFRALSFIFLSVVTFRQGRRLALLESVACSLLLRSFQQAVELRISHIDLIEQLVEVSCFVANVTLEPVWKEQPDKPLKAQNPIERRRPVNPPIWH